MRPPPSHLLTIREHEKVPILEDRKDRRRGVPARFANAIERMQNPQGVEIVTLGRRSLKAKQFVGTVGIPGFTLEILPKIDLDDDATCRRLLEMLVIAGLVPFREAGVAAQAAKDAGLIDAFLRTYIARLTIEWRRGRIRDYRRIARNRPYLKGKLDFPAHLRANLVRKDRFFTRAEEFLADVPVSRVLRTALDVCRTRSSFDRTRRDAAALLGEFEDVTPILGPSAVDAVVTDRRTERFATLLELAKLLIRSALPDRVGDGVTFCLAFDMNQVFESYVGALFRRAVEPPEESVRLQVSGRSLLYERERARFRLRPDIGICRRRKLVAIVDTKWKVLDPTRPHHGVSQADAYQAYAYGKEYGAPVVVLLYPRTGDLHARVTRYRHHPGDETSPRLEIRTVDVREDLRRDLRGALGLPGLLPPPPALPVETSARGAMISVVLDPRTGHESSS